MCLLYQGKYEFSWRCNYARELSYAAQYQQAKEQIILASSSSSSKVDSLQLYYTTAELYYEMENYQIAVENYERAININPNYSEAKFKLSLVYLRKENFSKGWKNYEGRMKINRADVNQKSMLTLNQWNGEKFKGTLYVRGEQGVGDQILHSSMIADLYRIHSDICLVIDDRLVSMFNRSFKKIKIVGYSKDLKFGQDDKHILIGSLGKILRKSFNDFQEKPLPYIIPDQKKCDEYKKILLQNKKIKVNAREPLKLRPWVSPRLCYVSGPTAIISGHI